MTLKHQLNKVLIILAATVCGSASAFPFMNKPCNQNGSDQAFEKVITKLTYNPDEDKVQKEDVMYMDGDDRRDYMSNNVETDDQRMKIDFSDDEMNTFLHTSGAFHCKSTVPNATVTATADLEDNGTIRLPKHAMNQIKFETCTFKTYAMKKPVKVNITDIKRTEWENWNKGGAKLATDNIVLSLVSRVELPPGISIPKYAPAGFKVPYGTKLYVVSSLQNDWGVARGLDQSKTKEVLAYKMKQPLAYTCESRAPFKNNVGFQTNCGSDVGGSGSKVYIRENNELVRVGMIVKGRNFQKIDGKEVPLKNGSPYNMNEMFSSAVSVSDDVNVASGTISEDKQTN